MIIEDVYYENSSGDVVSLFSNTIRANFKDARPFQYSVSNDELFNQGKDFQMLVLSVGRQYIDDLVSLLHKDIVANANGKLFINGWYLYCRYTGIRTIAHESSGFVKVEISFHAPSLLWTHIRKFEIYPQTTYIPVSPLNSGDNFLDMDYDLGYDVSNGGYSVKRIANEESELADVRISIVGIGEAFTLNVANAEFSNDYVVNEELVFGDELVIDGERKKVTIAGTDAFSSVPDSSDIFCKLPQGEYICQWTPDAYPIVVEVLEHRSVPLWVI